MRHQDPICKRFLDDDTRYITFTDCRVFYFCSEHCKQNFEAERSLYLVKRIDQEQRKSYKTRSVPK
jgi:YHS domain-containing protein